LSFKHKKYGIILESCLEEENIGMKTEQRTEKHAPYVVIPALIQVKHSNNVMIKSMVKLTTEINCIGTRAAKTNKKSRKRKKERKQFHGPVDQDLKSTRKGHVKVENISFLP
jgi:hypothetical protein